MSARNSRAVGPPASDVSVWVGLVGLAGLAAWILVCRNWPWLVDNLGFPGPSAPLSGPYASALTVLFTGGPMALWSVLVEKVHRRPSTGIDWDKPRQLASVIHVSVTKLAGLWATWALIGFAYCIARWQWDGSYLFAMELIGLAAIPTFVLSIPYVLWLDRRLKEPRDHAWHFGAMLIGREPWDAEEVKKHWRAWIIKGFFGAFMLSILPGGFAAVVEADYGAILHDPIALGLALFDLLFVIDVQIGTVGYLLTFRPLDAHIRSGNPYLGGWLAALMCYPPFVWGLMGREDVLAYEVNSGGWGYLLEGHNAIAWVWMAGLVFLTAVYAWATVAFGMRFSNLTYRGVLTNGPYRFTRHPAYVSKNLFWWFTALPFVVTNGSWTDAVRNTALLGIVSGIYYWRARTEEAHLLAEDPKYREYYDWMGEHGLLTSRLRKGLARFHRRPPVALQPAE
jgi:hypothetical protein